MGTSGGHMRTLRRWLLKPEEKQWGKYHMSNRSPRWWENERMSRMSGGVPERSQQAHEKAEAFADALAALYNPDLDRQGHFEATLKMIRHTGADNLYMQPAVSSPSGKDFSVGSPRKTFTLSLLLRHGFEEEHIVSVHALIYG
jgi:hypothetical protein